MKFAKLVIRNLFRKKLRLFFTTILIASIFFFVSLHLSILYAFDNYTDQGKGYNRLAVQSAISLATALPYSHEAKIRQIPGIVDVCKLQWIGAYYIDQRNFFANFAVDHDKMATVFDDYVVDPKEFEAFKADRQGALVGDELMKRFKWKVGDRIPMQSTIFPDKSGNKNWTFDIVGVLHSTDKKSSGFYDQMMLLQWKYFDDTTPYNRGTVGWYVTRVSDVNQADRVAKAIDALSANSDHETRTQTEQAATASWMKQFADIGLIVGSIMGAVFFTLLLLTGNTMAQAVRERTSELAVLKTIGFSNHGVLAMVLAESVLLLVIGGVVGLAIASAIIPAVSAGSGGMLNLPSVNANSWALGFSLMALIGIAVGALPAMSAMRLNIVDALAGR